MNLKTIKRTYLNHVEAFKQTYGIDSGLSLLIDVLAVLMSLWFLYSGVGTLLTVVSIAVLVWVLVDRARRIIGRLYA